MIMTERKTRLRLALALIILVASAAAPSLGDQKVSLFNPFTLQSKAVVAASSTPNVALNDLLLLSLGTTTSTLADGNPRPTISLRSVEIRIPQRADLRSAYSRIPYAGTLW
jgi:hypothetical protein